MRQQAQETRALARQLIGGSSALAFLQNTHSPLSGSPSGPAESAGSCPAAPAAPSAGPSPADGDRAESTRAGQQQRCQLHAGDRSSSCEVESGKQVAQRTCRRTLSRRVKGCSQAQCCSGRRSSLKPLLMVCRPRRRGARLVGRIRGTCVERRGGGLGGGGVQAAALGERSLRRQRRHGRSRRGPAAICRLHLSPGGRPTGTLSW